MPVDLDELETRLEKLMESYRDALKYVEHLPSIGRVSISTGEVDVDRIQVLQGIAKKSGIDTSHELEKPGYAIEYDKEKQSADVRADNVDKKLFKKSKFLASRAILKLSYPSHTWVARSLVRLFVESHIRSKLEVIIRYLRIETSACIKEPESNERAKKLKSYINQLDEFKKTLSGWNQPGKVVVEAPWLPAVIALATPALFQLIGKDTTVQLSLHALAALGLLLLYMYMLLSPLPIHLGFRVKRAIFVEGKTKIRGYFRKHKLIKWVGFPKTNIYQLEDQVFEVIGVPKPREFPLDFVMAFLPFYFFLTAIVILEEAVNQLISGTLELWSIFAFVVFWAMAGQYFRWARNEVRQRKKQKEM